MLQEFPQTRKDNNIQAAYSFVLDFLELTAKETQNMIKSNQLTLKKLLEAVKISEQTLEKLFIIEKEKVSLFRCRLCYLINMVIVDISRFPYIFRF